MKLVIFLTEESRRRQVEREENPIELTNGIITPRDDRMLEEYGQVWARWYKGDIVMLVEENE